MSNRTISVIGIAGGAGVGKDYIAKTYLARYGFRPYGLADELKIELVGKGVLTFEEAFELPKTEATRKLLVYRAESARMIEGPDCWVERARADMYRLEHRFGLNRFVITDLRRPFECDAVHALGGKVIGVYAPTRWAYNGLTEEMRAASPELFGREFWKYLSCFDAVIQNDSQDSEQLQRAITDTLTRWGFTEPVIPGIRLGTDTSTLAKPSTWTGVQHPEGLAPLCLTCGPKNMAWMGPTVQRCKSCQADYDRWRAAVQP